MPIPRLRIPETALLVIDVQERLMPAIVDRERVTTNCAILLRMADALELPYFVTEQYPRGLGRTVEEVASAMSDQSRRVEKTRFTAAIDIILEELVAWRRPTVLLAGVEAHVCVLQTVLDLQAEGLQSFMCTDAISASQPGQVGPAFERMQAAGGVPTGVLAAMYELMEDATHPAFRVCLDLARAVR